MVGRAEGRGERGFGETMVVRMSFKEKGKERKEREITNSDAIS